MSKLEIFSWMPETERNECIYSEYFEVHFYEHPLQGTMGKMCFFPLKQKTMPKALVNTDSETGLEVPWKWTPQAWAQTFQKCIFTSGSLLAFHKHAAFNFFSFFLTLLWQYKVIKVQTRQFEGNRSPVSRTVSLYLYLWVLTGVS